MKLTVVRCPSDELALTNCVIVSATDFPDRYGTQFVQIKINQESTGVFTIIQSEEISTGTIGLNLAHRKFLTASIGQEIDVHSYSFGQAVTCSKIIMEVDFTQKKELKADPIDANLLAADFISKLSGHVIQQGLSLTLKFQDILLVSLTAKEISVTSNILETGESATGKATESGILMPDTKIILERAEGSILQMFGTAYKKPPCKPLINPNWDFGKMGIGGLDKEFNAIFRRAFASRVFPPEIVEQLGCKHVKGILLYGPPGTGKTLMARQIGNMLNAKEPKIVNGPEILDKFVGQSEANVRKLFADAEEDEKRLGSNSPLHIIIFDEIDAICKSRGTSASSTGVNDTVVNQLLGKIDGVEQLNNILVIGMTNRKDLIDEALLRPGRLEVQMEISLPDETGRQDILKIHTNFMKQNGKLMDDVDIGELAFMTKNFSGAELEGLVRASQSNAMNRLIKADSKVEVQPGAMDSLRISRSDFINALEMDIKPRLGTSHENLNMMCGRGIINWGQPVSDILVDGMLLIKQARNSERMRLVTFLLEGPPHTGKTALAAELAKRSDFPFIKVCNPENMVGYSETAKCIQIRKVFDDAYKSSMSCILVDNIERLLDYSPVGPRYSNSILQTLLVLLKKVPPNEKKLLIICTSSRKDVLQEMGMLSVFNAALHVPELSDPQHILTVLDHLSFFSEDEIEQIRKEIEGKRVFVGISKLLGFVDFVRQVNAQNRVSKFLEKLDN